MRNSTFRTFKYLLLNGDANAIKRFGGLTCDSWPHSQVLSCQKYVAPYHSMICFPNAISYLQKTILPLSFLEPESRFDSLSTRMILLNFSYGCCANTMTSSLSFFPVSEIPPILIASLSHSVFISWRGRGSEHQRSCRCYCQSCRL